MIEIRISFPTVCECINYFSSFDLLVAALTALWTLDKVWGELAACPERLAENFLILQCVVVCRGFRMDVGHSEQTI